MSIDIFFSYVEKDSKFFRIEYIAQKLKSYSEIGNVFYWKKSATESIPKYMSEGIENCDIFILFCSPLSLKSSPVQKEWGEAIILDKKIIPVFKAMEFVPPMIKQFKGIQFDAYYIDQTIKELFDLIIKTVKIKVKSVKERYISRKPIHEKLFEKLFEDNGAENVDTAAIYALIAYIYDLAKEITEMAIDFATHAGRKKIIIADIELAIKMYNKAFLLRH